MTKKHLILISIMIAWLFGLSLGCYITKKHSEIEVQYVDKFIVEKDTLKITDTILMPVPANIDTVKVIQEHFTKQIIRDTVINNDTVLIVIRDTVYQNEIISRKFEYQNFMPIAYKTENTLSAGLNINTINGFGYGPAINYSHNKLTYGLTADLKNKIILGTITIKMFSN